MWSHINLEKDLRIWLSHIRRNSMTHSNSRNNGFWLRLNCEKGWFSCFLPPRQATPFLSFVHIIIFHPLAQTKEAIYRMRLCLSILWKRSLFLFSHSTRFSPCTQIVLIIIYFHLEGGKALLIPSSLLSLLKHPTLALCSLHMFSPPWNSNTSSVYEWSSTTS